MRAGANPRPLEFNVFHWLLSYTFGSKSFQVLINGYTGRIAGRRPYSWVKISLTAMVILAVVAIVVFLVNR